MTDYAKLQDLMICDNDQTGLLDGKTFGEHALFASGRPIIVAPPNHDQPFACDTVLVAWDYSRPAVRATADALPLLKMAKRVFIVTVSNDKEFKSGRSGTELARHLASWHRGSRRKRAEYGTFHRSSFACPCSSTARGPHRHGRIWPPAASGIRPWGSGRAEC